MKKDNIEKHPIFTVTLDEITHVIGGDGSAVIILSEQGLVASINELAKDWLDVKGNVVGEPFDKLGQYAGFDLSSYMSFSQLKADEYTGDVTEINLFPISWSIKRLTSNYAETFIILVGKSDATQMFNQAEVDKVKDYYENIIALMPGHVYWLDRDGVYQGCNDLQAQTCGLASRDEIVGKTNKDLPWFSKKNVGPTMIDFTNDEVMEAGVSKTIEEVSILDDGEEAIFLSKKEPLKDEDGKVVGLLGISFDITNRKKTEEALAVAKEQAEVANQIKSDFIACMSHDLRTPLNGIYGAIQVLQMMDATQKQKKFYDSIRCSTDNLLYLVEDILNFAKLESGKVELRLEPFDMRKLVEEVVDMMTHQVNEKNLKMIVSYCDSVPCYMMSDPHAVRRILINLISNAIKFTDEGHILVSVESASMSEEDAKIQISVEDTGIGIPRDKIDFIFDRFSRVDPSYKGRYKGTGLGLTIVKQLSEAIGGEVNVNSQVDCGSTFWCTLPIQLQDNAVAFSTWHKLYSDVRVLIVDDYTVRGNNIKKQLASKDNMVVNSADAYHVLYQSVKQKEPFQVVIVDDEIQAIKPLSLVRQIRENPDFNRMMMMLFNNKNSLSDNQAAKQAGVFKQLVKPIQPKELSDKLTLAWEEWADIIMEMEDKLRGNHYKVLLVEDETIAQTVSKALLEQLGCQVDIASTGAEALAKSKKYYDYIFMDIGLPDCNGLVVTRKIRAAEGPHRKVPIIGLTAHVFENDRKQCSEAGMNFFIAKPVAFKDFQDILAKGYEYVHELEEV